MASLVPRLYQGTLNLGLMGRKILVSAGEASGDLYASLVVQELRRIWPDGEFFGCTGPRMRAAGVETVVDAASLAVVGLVEVVAHIPRIYGEYRKLLAAASDPQARPGDPDRFARFSPAGGRASSTRRGFRWSIWWPRRSGRGGRDGSTECAGPCDGCSASFRSKRRFFSGEGVPATYIGHPLVGLVKPVSDAR